jgi:hypothetical protein
MPLRPRGLAWALLIASCGIDATHPDRCGPGDTCPEGRACQAGFCVLSDDVLARDADTGAGDELPVDPYDDAGAVGGGDATVGGDGDTATADGGTEDLPEPSCRSGVMCVGDQLVICAGDDVIGAQACPSSGECQVARCESGRGCVSVAAPDDVACSLGRCEGGVCVSTSTQQTCAESDCDLACSDAGAQCSLDCASSSNCKTQCDADTTCDVRCAGASNCEVKCLGQCTLACDDSSNCRADCKDGGSCDVSCPDEGNCDEIRCRGGSRCLLRCANSDDCAFKTCEGVELSCSPTLRACNRACP